MKITDWNLKQAQHQLENMIGLTQDERMWIMRHNTLPMVRTFWTAYKRGLNFLYDTDKVNNVKKHLTFVRSVIRSGLNIDDPRFKIL